MYPCGIRSVSVMMWRHRGLKKEVRCGRFTEERTGLDEHVRDDTASSKVQDYNFLTMSNLDLKSIGAFFGSTFFLAAS